MIPAGTFDKAKFLNPTGVVQDYSLLVNLSRMSPKWWDAVDTSDGTRGRASKGDGVTELACDWIDFDNVARTGLLIVLWSGLITPTGTFELRIYPPNTGNTAYLKTDVYGQYNAYNPDWEYYSPNGDGNNDRTRNQVVGSYNGSYTVDVEDGLLGKATLYNGSAGYWESTNPTLLTTVDMSMGGIIKTSGSAYSLGDKINQCTLRPYSGTLRYYRDGGYTSGPTYNTSLYNRFFVSVDTDGNFQFGVNDESYTSGNGYGSPTTFNIGYHYSSAQVYAQHIYRMSAQTSDAWRNYQYDQLSDNATFWGTWVNVPASGQELSINPVFSETENVSIILLTESVIRNISITPVFDETENITVTLSKESVVQNIEITPVFSETEDVSITLSTEAAVRNVPITPVFSESENIPITLSAETTVRNIKVTPEFTESENVTVNLSKSLAIAPEVTETENITISLTVTTPVSLYETIIVPFDIEKEVNCKFDIEKELIVRFEI